VSIVKTGPNTSSRATDIEFLTSVSSVGAKNQSRGRPAGRSPPQARVAPSRSAEATNDSQRSRQDVSRPAWRFQLVAVMGRIFIWVPAGKLPWPAGMGHQASAQASWLIEPAPRAGGRPRWEC
jgi:hypothetical protein